MSAVVDGADIFDMDEDFSDPVCAVCRGGGDMICCDGRCLRTFHPSCIGLREEDIPEDSPFVCSDCFCGIQRCFVCSDFGIEHELVKCSVPYCGKFYHESCVSESSQSNNYVCKQHSCDTCGEVVTAVSKRKTLWRCFRCPKAFDIKHRPRDVHVLADGLFLCIRHRQEDEVWPEISKELLERLGRQNKGLPQGNTKRHSTQSSLAISRSKDANLLEDMFAKSNNKSSNGSTLPNQRLGATRAAMREISEDELEKMRKMKEQRAQLSKEGDILAQSLMPKKRQTSGPLLEVSDLEEDVAKGSTLPSPSATQSTGLRVGRSGNGGKLSHLQRHNAARRKQKGNWNYSWNRHRAMQEREMGRSIVGQERFQHMTENGNGPAGALTSVMTPMGNMSRTDALLTALFNRDRQHEPTFENGDSGGWIGGGGAFGGCFELSPESDISGDGMMAGGHGLMRTAALLQSFMRGGAGPHFMELTPHHVHQHGHPCMLSNSGGSCGDMHLAKRHRTVPPSAHFDHDSLLQPHHPYHPRDNRPQFPVSSGWSGHTVPNQLPMCSYEVDWNNPLHPAPVMSGLSRTEQLLAATSSCDINSAGSAGYSTARQPWPWTTEGVPSEHAPMHQHFFSSRDDNDMYPPLALPSQHQIAHQQHELAQRRSNGHIKGNSSVSHDSTKSNPAVAPPFPSGVASAGAAGHDGSSNTSTGVTNASSSGEKSKMAASDLYAMLLATGMLPAKEGTQ